MLAFRRAARIDGGRLAHHQNRLAWQQAGLRFVIGAAHHVERRRQMDIGEAFELGSRGPIGETIRGQMDHHRAWSRTERHQPAVGFRVAAAVCEKLSEDDLRHDIGNDGAVRSEAPAIRKGDAGGPVIRPIDANDLAASDEVRRQAP